MLQHPWVLLAEYIKENWYTQKDFSRMIGKKTSEINELIRWKRNITVAWDIVLSKYLSTTPKFRILKQVDYDYEQLLSKQMSEDKWLISKDAEIFHENININKEIVEDNRQSTKVENSFLEPTLQDIIEEENRQSKYLRENIFQEKPIQEENLIAEKKIETNQNKTPKSYSINHFNRLKNKTRYCTNSYNNNHNWRNNTSIDCGIT